jgi:hypothetical protein
MTGLAIPRPAYRVVEGQKLKASDPEDVGSFIEAEHLRHGFPSSHAENILFIHFRPSFLNFNHRAHSAAEPQLKTLTTEGTEITEKLVKK